MKIYDISQEVFSCVTFPGDPVPKKNIVLSKENGDVCNLTEFSMCAHNGTHIDSPFHFLENGKTVDEIELEKFVGFCYVAEHNGVVTEKDAKAILEKAGDARCRILLKGKAEVSLEAAKVFAREKIYLVGNESQTVGPESAPMQVHMELLTAEVVLLEGIRLQNVPEGKYFLCAQPLNLSGSDGAPVRAILTC